MAATHLNEIREMKMRRPFVPFRIVTTNGDKYRVERRFQLAVTETRVIYVYPASDRFIELKADQIAGVELVESKPAA